MRNSSLQISGSPWQGFVRQDEPEKGKAMALFIAVEECTYCHNIHCNIAVLPPG